LCAGLLTPVTAHSPPFSSASYSLLLSRVLRPPLCPVGCLRRLSLLARGASLTPQALALPCEPPGCLRALGLADAGRQGPGRGCQAPTAQAPGGEGSCGTYVVCVSPARRGWRCQRCRPRRRSAGFAAAVDMLIVSVHLAGAGKSMYTLIQLVCQETFPIDEAQMQRGDTRSAPGGQQHKRLPQHSAHAPSPSPPNRQTAHMPNTHRQCGRRRGRSAAAPAAGRGVDGKIQGQLYTRLRLERSLSARRESYVSKKSSSSSWYPCHCAKSTPTVSTTAPRAKKSESSLMPRALPVPSPPG